MNSSSGESTTPLDFHISSSCEDDSKLNIYTEDCPLCLRGARNFYCKKCINDGEFFHSDGRRYSRFADLRSKMFKLLKEKQITEIACNEGLKQRLKFSKLRAEIELIREKNEIRRRVIDGINRSISEKQELVDKIKRNLSERTAKVQRYDMRVSKLSILVIDGHKKILEMKDSIFQAEQALKKARCYNIKHLVTYIFPISEITPVKKRGVRSAICALEEACRTAYGQGQWIIPKTSERQHIIVAPSLLASGDYSSYTDYVEANKDGVPSTSNSVNEVFNPASTICGALTYTTQLVEMLAYYLDVRLPAKLSYGDFCSPEVIKTKFTKRVARLNWNVLHLCLSQDVDPRLLKPETTLSNLLLLLDHNVSDLGKSSTPDKDPENSRKLEEALRPLLEVDDPSDNLNDDEGISHDWEAVPASLPESEPVPVSPSMSTTSITGGLLTSTAASLASMFGWNR